MEGKAVKAFLHDMAALVATTMFVLAMIRWADFLNGTILGVGQ